MKILVAEDESIIALDVKLILEANGHSVIGTARNYNGVEQRVKKETPDILITSLSLKNSEDYFERISALQKEFSFGVIFLSAQLNLSKYRNVCDSNYFSFLKKPFDSESLISCLNSIMGGSLKKI